MKYVTFLLCLLFINACFSKPMMSPTIEEASKSEYIVVVDYLGYEKPKGKKISYFNGPVATFKVISVLKGTKLGGEIRVKYLFHDLSACLEDDTWSFEKYNMPELNSRWILFIRNKGKDDVFSTYRGDWGRWIYSEENLKKVESLCSL